MLFDKISLMGGATAENIAIVSGATLPVGSIGELFYKTGTDEGLYYYGTEWMKVGSGSGGGVESGATLPAGTYIGQMFTKTGDNTNTYIFNGEEWVVIIEVSNNLPGTLWSWGQNNTGELGLGDQVHRSSPVQVGSGTNWKYISGANNSSFGIKTDGTLWSWGRNDLGQLGDGTTVAKSSPIQIGSGTNWKYINGSYHTLSVKTDGTLWAWGYNVFGQLGDGTTGSKSSPIQIGSGANWKFANSGLYFSAAIKTDGTLWTWGNNDNGQLGHGVFEVSKSSPIQVGLLNNWVSISCGSGFVAALKTDGTLWVWGENFYGQFGIGNSGTRSSSPIQVGLLNNWKSVTCTEHCTIAIKTDGTLWAWGQNDFGQLGDGTIIQRTSPVQIGSGTDWKTTKSINSSGSVIAIKTNGTLWAWGNNGYGQLGDGTRTHRSSPVQIGSGTNWKSIASNSGSAFAIK